MLDAFVERQTRTVRGNQILIGLRLLMATVSLAVLMIQDAQMVRSATKAAEIPPIFFLRPPGLVALIVCVLTIAYSLVARRSKKDVDDAAKLALVQIFVDVFLISALLWHTGGPNSQFLVLYLIAISASAFVLKQNIALLTAAVSVILFCVVTLLYSMGIIPEDYLVHGPKNVSTHIKKLGIGDFLRSVLLPCCAFFLTGLLAGALSRRLAIARLLQSEILEGIGEGLLVVDRERKLQYHNNQAERMLGLKVAPGSTINALLGQSVDDQSQSAVVEAKPRRMEFNYKRQDGKIIPLAVRINPILDVDSSSRSEGLILALDDISAEKKMEEFLKHRQRIETMGQISATIAHEIRNPLASIRGAVQEIGRAIEIPENKKVLLEIVLSESDRLDQIITDFLRFARMRPPKLLRTDLGRLLSDVKLLLASRPESKDINITLGGDEGEPFNADPEQLRQVFLNLGVNAIQAMSESSPRNLALRVRSCNLHSAPGISQQIMAERVNRPGVLVEVEDTGGGISPDVAAQIFEPFFTTKSAGTGLGLAIVERIIQSHEGLILLESKVGEGSVFRVWLPTDLTVAASVSGLRPVVI